MTYSRMFVPVPKLIGNYMKLLSNPLLFNQVNWLIKASKNGVFISAGKFISTTAQEGMALK